MDVPTLQKLPEAELGQWVAAQAPETLRQTFQSIDSEIRGARLTAGAPRSASSVNSVELAKLASRLAEFSGREEFLVESWRLLSYSLNSNEQYDASIPFYERAIPGLEKMGNSTLAARTRIGYVYALFHSGKYQEALKVSKDAEHWFKDNNDEVGLARLYTNTADIYHRLDEHALAYRYHLTAVETFEKIGDKQALAQSALNVANALAFTDRFEESDVMYAKSEALSEELGLTELWAQSSYNRAYLYYLRGRYSDALHGFSRLRSRFEASGSERHSALCDLDESEMYVHLNLSQDAATLARRAVDRFTKLGLTYELAKATAFLGVALIQQGRYTDALEAFHSAQTQFEKEGNNYWVAVLDLYRAEAHISLKRLWEARSLAARAKARFAKIGIDTFGVDIASDPSKKILSLVVLGRVCLELKDIVAAQECVAEIAKLVKETGVPMLLFPYHVLRGDIAERNERWTEAEQAYEDATRDLELHQTRLHHDDLRVTFFNGRNRAYEELVWLKLREPDSPASIAAAYAWCERTKSRGLIELLSHHMPSVQGQAEQSLLTKINRLREELNMLYVRSQPEQRAIPSQASFETIANKENELARSLREVSRVDPEYASLQQMSTATLDSVQEMLPPDTTMVEYFVARDEVLAFVVSGGETSVERHLCPVSRINDLQQRLGFQLEKFQLGQQYLDNHSDQIFIATQKHLGELYRNLFERLRDRIRTRRLVIIPHGVLHLLPFHALFDGEQYLIDHFEISYAPSASVLKYCLEKKDFDHEEPSLIGVADAQAPFVEAEIRTLEKMFPKSQVLLNGAATRDAFSGAAAKASFLHIATHAIFRQDNPMFSGFKLADGWMTAFDLFSMTCQENLVTLSSCKSGMSQVTGGDDLVGLMRGFLYAGARSLLVSLWNVDDETTSKLMSRFYDLWRDGVSRSAALTLAMKSIRESHPNPFYWAPFLLVGKG